MPVPQSLRPSIRPCVSPSICPTVHPLVHPSVCPSVLSSVYPFVRLFVRPSVRPRVSSSSVRPSVRPAVRSCDTTTIVDRTAFRESRRRSLMDTVPSHLARGSKRTSVPNWTPFVCPPARQSVLPYARERPRFPRPLPGSRPPSHTGWTAGTSPPSSLNLMFDTPTLAAS